MNILWQTACLVFGQGIVDSYALLFILMAVGRNLDSMKVPTWTFHYGGLMSNVKSFFVSSVPQPSPLHPTPRVVQLVFF